MSFQQVLVIEDDEAIRLGIVDALESAGYDALEAGTAEDGLSIAHTSQFDLVLLDVVLPGMDGMDALQMLKEVQPSIPIIMLTARGTEEDRVRGLNLGADDYVVKPFSVNELLARIEAVLRRCQTAVASGPQIGLTGGRSVDLASRTVRFDDGREVELSERESELLKYFCSRGGQIVSRQDLMKAVWRINPRGLQTRTVDMHIARLRDKLCDGNGHAPVIVTERGRGYRLVTSES